NAGLRIYSPSSNGVYQWIELTAQNSSLASNQVTDLSYLDGKLWVATANAGLSVFNLAANTWQQMNTNNTPLPSNGVNQITRVGPLFGVSDLWFSTQGGAARYSPASPGSPWTVYTTANSGLLN